MKTWLTTTLAAMMALTIPACTADTGTDDPASSDSEVATSGDEATADKEKTGEAEQALCQYNYIYHYDYSDSTGTYHWNVSYNYSTGKWYVDERRIGGGFYQQYSLTPGWTVCPSPLETISLKNGTHVQTGPHNCLPNNNEEVHLDKQRLLVRQSPFATFECL